MIQIFWFYRSCLFFTHIWNYAIITQLKQRFKNLREGVNRQVQTSMDRKLELKGDIATFN